VNRDGDPGVQATATGADTTDAVTTAILLALAEWEDIPVGTLAGVKALLLRSTTPDARLGRFILHAGDVQDVINRVAAAMTDAGVRYPVQVGVLVVALGIQIGPGGSGYDVTQQACPWCAAYGGGGHGGFCPGPFMADRP
jgi:hypothetical protein